MFLIYMDPLYIKPFWDVYQYWGCAQGALCVVLTKYLVICMESTCGCTLNLVWESPIIKYLLLFESRWTQKNVHTVLVAQAEYR